MGQQREHSGHRNDAMIRIVEAREKFDTRKSRRPKQTYRIVGTDAQGNPIGQWDHEKGVSHADGLDAGHSGAAEAGLSA